MSAEITVKEFKYIPGVNDAEYIKKLEELREIDKEIINTAVAKIKRLSAQMKEQPEIIRCKDCKHWIPYDWMFSEVWQSQNMADYPEDEIGCNYCDMAMKANDFCSRAEKRGEE